MKGDGAVLSNESALRRFVRDHTDAFHTAAFNSWAHEAPEALWRLLRHALTNAVREGGGLQKLSVRSGASRRRCLKAVERALRRQLAAVTSRAGGRSSRDEEAKGNARAAGPEHRRTRGIGGGTRGARRHLRLDR